MPVAASIRPGGCTALLKFTNTAVVAVVVVFILFLLFERANSGGSLVAAALVDVGSLLLFLFVVLLMRWCGWTEHGARRASLCVEARF